MALSSKVPTAFCTYTTTRWRQSTSHNNPKSAMLLIKFNRLAVAPSLHRTSYPSKLPNAGRRTARKQLLPELPLTAAYHIRRPRYLPTEPIINDLIPKESNPWQFMIMSMRPSTGTRNSLSLHGGFAQLQDRCPWWLRSSTTTFSTITM